MGASGDRDKARRRPFFRKLARRSHDRATTRSAEPAPEVERRQARRVDAFGASGFAEPLFVLDTALREIAAEVAQVQPERGGALLGLRDKSVITEFLLDVDALTTTATYQPSRELAERVKGIETVTPLQFKGILHSHPGSLDRPSSQDKYELDIGLRLNPHLTTYLAPIVTLNQDARASHEIEIGAAKLSCYAAARRREGIVVLPQDVHEIPLGRHADLLSSAYEAIAVPEIFVTEFEDCQMLAARIRLDEGTDLLLLTSEIYPRLPPVALLTLNDETTEQIQLRWRLELEPDLRIADALEAGLQGTERFRHNSTTRLRPPDPAGTTIESDIADWLSRQGSLVTIRPEAEVLLVGAGSVGSVAAEQLARSGVQRFTVIDPQRVDPANLSRSIYETTDLGSLKVSALERLLLRATPDLTVQAIPRRLQDFELAEIDALVRRATVVLAATDDPEAQRFLNALAYAAETPAVFPGLYAGARGGEIIFTDPPNTACFLCATAARLTLGSEDIEPGHDYGAGQLVGEIAVAADIHHVTMAAVKLTLALAADEESPIRTFASEPAAKQMTYLTLSMEPEFWFYPSIFLGVRNQYAYQSVWIIPDRLEDCPVCGKPEFRKEPSASDAAGPSVASLQQRAAERAKLSAEEDRLS